jgi:hypothetical protein
MWAFVSVHTISALHFSFVLLYSFEWRTFYAFTGNIVRHLSFRLRLFVGLVMVRALHFLFVVSYGSKWRTFCGSTFQYCTSSDLSFTSIRGFSDIVVLGNDGTYRALHLLFVLIYCVSNDPLLMRLLSNIVRHEHSSIGGYSVLTGVVSTMYFVEKEILI